MNKPNDRALRPSLEKQQIWRRNQDFKNWGTYTPLFFREGIPRLIVSSYIFFFWLIVFCLYCTQRTGFNLLVCPFIISIIISVWLFVATDPGVCSSSYPILNQQQLRLQKGFCANCRIFKQKNTQHCKYCKVCIENTLYHSTILKCCITKQNIKALLFLHSSILFYLLTTFLIYLTNE